VPPEEGGRFAEVFDRRDVALPDRQGRAGRIGYFKKKKG